MHEQRSPRVPLASVGVSFADLWPDEAVHDDGAGEDAAATAAAAAAPEATNHGWIERMPPTCGGDAAKVRVSAMRRRTLVRQGAARAATWKRRSRQSNNRLAFMPAAWVPKPIICTRITSLV